jgi:hypothetical protein
MNKNKESTRYYSDAQEKLVCKNLGAKQQPNSGAGKWRKGDCVVEEASILIECKTTMSEKSSYSIKKDVLLKNKEEAFSNRLSSGCLCFDFGPNTDRYYVIDEKNMKFLIEKLIEENNKYGL